MTLTAGPSHSTGVPLLFSCGKELDRGPEAIGGLRESQSLLADMDALRKRMNEQGYLLLRGLLNREDVFAARRFAAERLFKAGHIEPGTDLMDCIATKGSASRSQHDIAKGNHSLYKVLYSGRMIQFFEAFIGEPVRHYDFTWFRAIAPGRGTPPHCDVVYMGRGERERLYTAWCPIGDITYDMGGLLVLEGSNNLSKLRKTYGQSDVDSYCSNREGLAARDHWGRGRSNGWLGQNPPQLRRALGSLRWLTSEFRAGDALIFSMYTVHGSLDNRSDRIRLSSDSRYQPASKPADERWIGPNPIGHTDAGKRGKIC